MKYPEIKLDATLTDSWKHGVDMLAVPAWPLCNMAIMLFLAGPYLRFAELLADMPEQLGIASITYQKPAKILTKYLDFLNIFETFKTSDTKGTGEAQKNGPIPSCTAVQKFVAVFSTADERLEPFEAVLFRTKHNILDRELETINSLLCAPCACTLCCTGPARDAEQEFFEIPLSQDEIHLFDLPVIDSEKSQETTPYAENALVIAGKPFYCSSAALYNWSDGWSMVLTRGSVCPALARNGACAIYQDRPEVCRKPQIFAAVLEQVNDTDYTLKNNLLAVLDCPYVRHLSEEITGYAALNETDLIFRKNKT